MIGIVEFLGGLAAANVSEWVIHRYVLHGLGKKKDSFWAFHWKEHHRSCRRNNFYDPDYDRSPFGMNAQGKEAAGLLALSAAVAPLGALSWPFVFGLWTSMATYYAVHKSSHLSSEWAKKWLPHHYDHHMGKNQDANWCVTFPLTDWIMKTRLKERESD